jgi:hypothetical protein
MPLIRQVHISGHGQESVAGPGIFMPSAASRMNKINKGACDKVRYPKADLARQTFFLVGISVADA